MCFHASLARFSPRCDTFLPPRSQDSRHSVESDEVFWFRYIRISGNRHQLQRSDITCFPRKIRWQQMMPFGNIPEELCGTDTCVRPRGRSIPSFRTRRHGCPGPLCTAGVSLRFRKKHTRKNVSPNQARLCRGLPDSELHLTCWS